MLGGPGNRLWSYGGNHACVTCAPHDWCGIHPCLPPAGLMLPVSMEPGGIGPVPVDPILILGFRGEEIMSLVIEDPVLGVLGRSMGPIRRFFGAIEVCRDRIGVSGNVTYPSRSFRGDIDPQKRQPLRFHRVSNRPESRPAPRHELLFDNAPNQLC